MEITRNLTTVRAGDKFRVGQDIIITIDDIYASRFADQDDWRTYVRLTWHNIETDVTRVDILDQLENTMRQVTGRTE
jgi:hypothetical protein